MKLQIADDASELRQMKFNLGRGGRGLRLILDLLNLQLLVDQLVDEDNNASLADIHQNEARSDIARKREQSRCKKSETVQQKRD